MRLVCPNCGAQYEVDDRVMPENGRDVQCSNCGHGWFQLPLSAEPEETEELPSPFDVDDDVDDDEVDPTVDAVEDVLDAAADDVSQEPDADNGDTDAVEDVVEDAVEDAEKESDGPSPDLQARTLDDDVRSILQEEAEQELQARQSEQGSIETQTDMGLEDSASERDDVKARVARLRGHEDEFESGVQPDDLKGRDVLPDIEEINSTLDASEYDPGNIAPDDPILAEAKSGGFRRGFTLIVVLACLLAILYIFAPTLADRFPPVRPAIEQYVDIADRVRVGLEELMRSAIGKMQGLIDKPENG